jgi:hypothetical protein
LNEYAHLLKWYLTYIHGIASPRLSQVFSYIHHRYNIPRRMSQPEQYYQRVQGIITGIITRVRWNEPFADLFNMDNPYSNQELTNTECRVGYEKFSNENRAWAISLVLMSWALKDFQTKMEDGYCHNTAHVHGPVKPRNCEEGQNFHRDMFNKCLRLYQNTNEFLNKRFDPYIDKLIVEVTQAVMRDKDHSQDLMNNYH